MSRSRERSLTALVALAGCGLGLLWWLLPESSRLTTEIVLVEALLFVVAAVVMELLPIRLADGRPVPTSLAVVGAAALLGVSPPGLGLLAAAGHLGAVSLRRERLDLDTLLQRAIGGWVLAGVAVLGAALGPPTWTGTATSGVAAELNLGAAAAVGLAILVGVPAMEALATSTTGLRHAHRWVLEEIHRNRLIGASVAATAALGALVHPVLGAWMLPTMLLPLLAARTGLDRLALGQRAYEETIRAMSRLPEQLGSVDAGHGVRVAELARSVALELGLDAASVADTVRAAHLHELGRIRLEREAPADARDLATAGAEVLHEVGGLDRVAAIVAAQADVSAHPRDDVGLPARIVVACCDLDSYAPDPRDAGQRHEATVRLVRDVGDLEVIAALRRVVDRAPLATPLA
ncbi:MAG: HD domain-containing protein [Nitriliruptoraceae bacterium]